MKRMEIRCCCTPKKLLGWVEVPDGATEYRFVLRSELLSFLRKPFDDVTPVKVEAIVLPVAVIHIGGTKYPALKSEETPIEILRKIPGFIENRDSGPDRHLCPSSKT